MDQWISQVWQAFRANTLTRAHRDVLLQLPKFRGPGGIFPSHESVARRVKCCVRTVQRAFDAARSAGILDWIGRRKRAAWGTEQTSNLYRLIVKNPGKPPAGQECRRATQENSFFLTASADRPDSLAALARVLAERQRKIAQEWRAGRSAARSAVSET